VNRSLVGVCQILVAKGAVDDAARLAAALLDQTAAAADSWAEHLALGRTLALEEAVAGALGQL
jgi:hypothetical protein